MSTFPFSSVITGDSHIAMTFDDGPHAVNSPRLIDIAAERQIRLTFFIQGKCAEANPDLVRRAANDGHEIANHTWSHPNLSKLSIDEVRTELLRTDQIIDKISGTRPRAMRPPYGELTPSQQEWIEAEFGYKIILWSVDPRDWQDPGAEAVASRILSETRPGSIILSHESISSTIDAMPQVFDTLIEKGFKFVTVSEIILLAAC
jgi:peptidoglycan/xylan/chitin deacetylase (PgdA/CDA1 family)